jgi:hypothetical protein
MWIHVMIQFTGLWKRHVVLDACEDAANVHATPSAVFFTDHPLTPDPTVPAADSIERRSRADRTRPFPPAPPDRAATGGGAATATALPRDGGTGTCLSYAFVSSGSAALRGGGVGLPPPPRAGTGGPAFVVAREGTAGAAVRAGGTGAAWRAGGTGAAWRAGGTGAAARAGGSGGASRAAGAGGRMSMGAFETSTQPPGQTCGSQIMESSCGRQSERVSEREMKCTHQVPRGSEAGPREQIVRAHAFVATVCVWDRASCDALSHKVQS